MARTILDAYLHEIRTRTIRLGTLVATALDLALQALQSRDQRVCSQLIEADKTIDDLRFEVEQLTFRTLTLQQPLAGQDLRFLWSIPSIVANLERIGDNAAGMARLVQLVAAKPPPEKNLVSGTPAVADDQKPSPLTEASIVCMLLDLGQEAQHVLGGTMQAFERNDAQAARMFWQEDDGVDVRYHKVRYDLMTMLTKIHATPALQQDSCVLQRMTYWLWMAHKLERVGDHCTTICERIVFFLEGAATIHPTQGE